MQNDLEDVLKQLKIQDMRGSMRDLGINMIEQPEFEDDQDDFNNSIDAANAKIKLEEQRLRKNEIWN